MPPDAHIGQVRSVPLASITIPPNRQRRTFDPKAIADLAESIARLDLLQAPVVRPDGDTYTLIAGERRLRALKSLIDSNRFFRHNGVTFHPDAGHVPVTFLSDLSETDRFEAELHENLLREDLPWPERAAALAELHRRRTAENPGHTKDATAEEVGRRTGSPPATVVDDLTRALVVDKFKSDPQVAAARNLREAHKIATAKIRAEFQADLRALEDAKGPSIHTLIQTDCREWLPAAPDGVFDLILSDPPYGMGADSFGDAGPAHSYSDSTGRALEISFGIISEGFRITRSAAHLYLFCDIEHFFALRECAKAVGWYAWRTPITWVKDGGRGHNPIPEIGFRRQTEWLFYAIKGNRPANFLCADVLSATTVAGLSKEPSPEHAAAKPVALFEYLIRRSCLPGDQVLDPCAGSGTIFEAASRCAVRATGLEIDPGFVDLARGRV